MIVLSSSLLSSLRMIIIRLGALIWPPQCGRCGANTSQQHTLCASCWGTLHFVSDPYCKDCGVPLPDTTHYGNVCARCLAEPPAFDGARSSFVYDEGIRPLILAYKHSDRLDLTPILSQFLLRTLANTNWAVDVIVPVPLHRWRLFRRQYNQSAELARHLSRYLAVPFLPNIIKRVRSTPSQGLYSRAQRRANMTGAFHVTTKKSADLRGRTVLIVDDVLTTGATVNELARVIKKSGADQVFVITIACVNQQE